MSDSIEIIRPDIFRELQFISCGISTRRGGVSPHPLGMNLSFCVGDRIENVVQNRRIFFDSMGISDDNVAIPAQVHSSNVSRVSSPGGYEACDALIANTPGVFCAVSIADCAPVFLVDKSRKAVAAVHSGWRGSAGRIVSRTIQRMRESFGTVSSDLIAYIGPSAGVCCYEVGDDVALKFEKGYLDKKKGKKMLNLKKAISDQFIASGVPDDQIEVSNSCTICDEALFHSHRRDGIRSGRTMGVIGIKKSAS